MDDVKTLRKAHRTQSWYLSWPSWPAVVEYFYWRRIVQKTTQDFLYFLSNSRTFFHSFIHWRCKFRQLLWKFHISFVIFLYRCWNQVWKCEKQVPNSEFCKLRACLHNFFCLKNCVCAFILTNSKSDRIQERFEFGMAGTRDICNSLTNTCNNFDRS